MDVFIILQLYRSIASPTNAFRVRAKGGKQQHYKKLKQIRYYNIANIAECLCKIGCTSKSVVV